MKPMFQIVAAAALLALGACSTGGLDAEPPVTAEAAHIAAGVPQFAGASAALPAMLAEGKKVTYLTRAQMPVISAGFSANCPYAQGTGVYTAAAAPLRSVDGGRYKFTNY
jgi:hypothetical protein